MFSQLVRDKIRELQAGIPPVNLADPAVFLHNLLFLAAVMKATEGLLADGFSYAQGKDQFSNRLAQYYLEHYAEEQGHYQWIMEDLGLQNLPHVDWIAAEMAGAQYYLIHHVHACALLGYMAVLEGDPVPLAVVEQLEVIHGKRLLRCIRYHAEHDLEHRKELFALIDKVPSGLQSVVMESAMHTVLQMHAAYKTWS
jgi:hypothetical protein